MIPQVITNSPGFQTIGTPYVSTRLYPVSKERLQYVEVKVPAGYQLPTKLPFGVIAEIVNEQSSQAAMLQLWIAPGFFDGTPAFAKIKVVKPNFSEYIAEAVIETQIVRAEDFAHYHGDIWDIVPEVINPEHTLRTTVRVKKVKERVRGIYDDQLKSSHRITEVLVKKNAAISNVNYPAGLVDLGGGVYENVSYEEVNCNWYLRTGEQITAGTKYTYQTSKSHYWPAVLESGPDIAPLYGETEAGETYVAANLTDIRLKESYSGPCKATVIVAWSAAPPSSTTPDYMIADSVDYVGIAINIKIPECLHGVIAFKENIFRHPVLKDNQHRSKVYPATTNTDWPDSVTFMGQPNPYKGGFITELWEVFKPGTA